MTRIMKSTAALAMFMIFVGVAAAGPAPEPGGLADLQYFVGQWTCDTSYPAGPAGQAYQGKRQVSIEKELDSTWVTVRFTETAPGKPTLRVATFWGYDSIDHRFVRFNADNEHRWMNGSSTGWQGDKFAWEGEMHGVGPTTPYRHTFTRAAPSGLTEQLELQLGGKWVPVGSGSCKRAK